MFVVSFLQLNKKVFNVLQGKQPYLENVCISVIERPNQFYHETYMHAIRNELGKFQKFLSHKLYPIYGV